MPRTIDEAEARIAQLEKLVSAMRHDIAGALTPGLMVADRLRTHPQPDVQASAAKIAASILRATQIARDSRSVVPAAGSSRK